MKRLADKKNAYKGQREYATGSHLTTSISESAKFMRSQQHHDTRKGRYNQIKLPKGNIFGPSGTQQGHLSVQRWFGGYKGIGKAAHPQMVA
jgi:hypothetical protein